jgi:hypothetical protein
VVVAMVYLFFRVSWSAPIRVNFLKKSNGEEGRVGGGRTVRERGKV